MMSDSDAKMSDINNDSDYDNESGEDSTSQSDSEFSGSGTGITEHRPDYQGALVRANKALGDIFNDMDPDDSSWIDANYQRDIGLKIEIDYTANGGVCLMENLRRKVFNELNNYPIASTNQSSSTTSPLETTRAYNISWAFFKNMVDPVCDRVHAIIHAHANLSAVQAATAKAQHQDSATPEVVGDMDRTLAALLGADAKTKAISTLRHQIELYRWDKRWGDIKRLVSDSPLTPEGASFLSGCPPSSRGESNISRAMAAICNIMEMDKAAFQLYLKNAAVLSALVQVWGRGGIMLAHWQPRSGPGYVPPTHATLMYEIFLAN